MNKIFLVTVGEYYDYYVEGAFSTKRKAERFISNNPGGCIEEVLIDELENVRPIKVFYCYINLESGEIGNEGDSISRIKNKTRRLVRRYKCNIGSRSEGACVYSTHSAEHARKCAVEARQKYLRNGKLWEGSFDINNV